MKIGLAEVNITPPLAMQIPGYGAKERLSTGVKDELFAKAMVVEAGETVLAFIVLDIISLELEPNRNIRRRVSAHTGIPEEQVMVSCTHTHTGPPRPLDDDALSYYPVLEAKAADAAIIAFHRRESAKIGFGRGHEDTIAFNRRFFMKDGTVKTNPGILNPEIDRPEGPIDPEVIVIRIDNADGEPIGVVSNYAVHTDVVSGTEYSADYPGFISKTIKHHYGEQVVSLFMQGACGNINHHDVTGRTDTSVSHRERMGTRLGMEIAKVRNQIKTAEGPSAIASRSLMVEASERELSEAELAWARQTLEAIRGMEDGQMTSRQIMERDRAVTRLESAARPLPVREYEIQVCAIGDLAVVALPAEMFVEFGLEIKARSPYAYTIINELSNGSGNGYVCTPAAYERGGYEPSGNKFAVGAGQSFVEAAVKLLHELYDESSRQ